MLAKEEKSLKRFVCDGERQSTLIIILKLWCILILSCFAYVIVCGFCHQLVDGPGTFYGGVLKQGKNKSCYVTHDGSYMH